MKSWIVGLALTLGCLFPLTAQAFTCAATGCTFEAAYTEPTTNTAGGPITDLANTKIYYTINGGAEKSVTVPASKATGGGAITRQITDTALLPGFNYTISATVTASNAAGESVRSAPATLAIPRSTEVPPLTGSGLILR